MTLQSQTSPQRYARAGGAAYLIIIIAGACGELLVRNAIIVSGDAIATHTNLLASQNTWRIGIAGDLLMHLMDLVVLMAYYYLLRPINKNLAQLAIFFGLIQTAVLVANKMNLVVPLFFVEDSAYLQAFTKEQVAALSYLSIKAHNYGFGVGLLFFGGECLIDGYLIYRSGYLPRALGVMIASAGAGYLINSFTLILAPSLTEYTFPILMGPILIAETSMALWLLFKGVNMNEWNKVQEATS
ncbi:MAG: DUF4386 domain-containing protein [Cyclobacteriaceae bacterium]|nr:DUF4386 domain-containing protein [Cyclobacteriaceae bacterium]